MKKLIYILLGAVLLSSCTITSPLTRGKAYPKVYDEKPLAIAVMPPINKTNIVEAKEYLYLTLPQTLSERGYYVISPFLSMEMFKTESAYDAEMFIDGKLNRFQEVLGADAMLFTTIHTWDKNKLTAQVTVCIEYTLRSTKTNETIFQRKGTMVYDASVSSNSGGGLVGLAVSMAANAIATAATDYVKIARACNNAALADMPSGKYSPAYLTDKEQGAGAAEFRQTIR